MHKMGSLCKIFGASREYGTEFVCDVIAGTLESEVKQKSSKYTTHPFSFYTSQL